MKWNNQLILSNLHNDKIISVDVDVSRDLAIHHIHGIRFLFRCFSSKKNGAILNHDEGMRLQLQVSAFLNALSSYVTTKQPVLIICPESAIRKWQLHLRKYAKSTVLTLNEENYEEVLKGEHKIVLTDVKNTKLLRLIKHLDYFCVCVDELDKVITQNGTKGYNAKFKIGLTHRNFLKNPDSKLVWSMLNWSNVEKLGKLADFVLEYESYINSRKFPYADVWHRLTWRFCDSFKQTPAIEINDDFLSDQHSNESKVQKRKLLKTTSKGSIKSKKVRSNGEGAKFIPNSTPEDFPVDLDLDEGIIKEVAVNPLGSNIKTELDECCSLSMLYGANETTYSNNFNLPIKTEANIPSNEKPTAQDAALSLLFGD